MKDGCMNSINIALERSVVQGCPPLAVRLRIYPLFKLFVVDALVLFDEVNQQLGFAFDTLKHRMVK